MTHSAADSISEQIESILTSIASEIDTSEKNVYQIDDTTLQINQQIYRVVKDYREGFDFVAFEARYQEYFEKFDFIVGDWGYEQLRLRGFYQLNKRKVPREQTIDYLEDYLKEYCNFGCRYFVLAKEEALLKYNQLTQGTPQKMKKNAGQKKRAVNTRSEKASPLVAPLKVKKATKNDKKEAFQIKAANAAKVKKQSIPQLNAEKTAVQANPKRHFVIKQHQPK